MLIGDGQLKEGENTSESECIGALSYLKSSDAKKTRRALGNPDGTHTTSKQCCYDVILMF